MQLALFLCIVAEAAVTPKPEAALAGPSGRADCGWEEGWAYVCTFRRPDGGGPAGEWLGVGGRPIGGLPG